MIKYLNPNWSKTKPLGINVILINLGKKVLKGEEINQLSCQKEILVQLPRLKEANFATCNQARDIFNQGLLRLLPYFPDVSQSKESLPWILFTTLHQRASFSWINLQPHFANKATFLLFGSPQQDLHVFVVLKPTPTWQDDLSCFHWTLPKRNYALSFLFPNHFRGHCKGGHKINWEIKKNRLIQSEPPTSW